MMKNDTIIGFINSLTTWSTSSHKLFFQFFLIKFRNSWEVQSMFFTRNYITWMEHRKQLYLLLGMKNQDCHFLSYTTRLFFSRAWPRCKYTQIIINFIYICNWYYKTRYYTVEAQFNAVWYTTNLYTGCIRPPVSAFYLENCMILVVCEKKSWPKPI